MQLRLPCVFIGPFLDDAKKIKFFTYFQFFKAFFRFQFTHYSSKILRMKKLDLHLCSLPDILLKLKILVNFSKIIYQNTLF